jgi:hypothetical protein
MSFCGTCDSIKETDDIAPVIVTGRVMDTSGKPAVSGWVEFRLQPDNQALPYSVLPGLVVANPSRGFIVAGGNVVQHPGGTSPFLVWPNDVIVPANTLYQVTIAPCGVVTRVYNGVLISQSINPQDLANLTFVSPQNNVVGPIIDANPLVSMSIVPGVDNAFTIGQPNARYASGWFNTLNINDLSVSTLTVGGNDIGTLVSEFFINSELVYGQPNPGQPILIYTFPFSVNFPADLQNPTSYFTVGNPPLTTATFHVLINGNNMVDINVAPDGTVTYVSAGFSVSANDRLAVIAPDPSDPNLTDPAFTLTGTRAS